MDMASKLLLLLSPKVMAWKEYTLYIYIVDGTGELGPRLFLQLHDHR